MPHAAMFYVILLLYLILIVGCLGMLVGWVPAARQLWDLEGEQCQARDDALLAAGKAALYTRLVQPFPAFQRCWALRWSKAFQVSVSIAEHAIFMLIGCALRVWQLTIDGSYVIGRADVLLALFLAGLADSQRRLNRAAALKADGTLRWQWYAFNALVMGTAIAVGMLALFRELGYIAPA